MVEQVKELGAEMQALPFAELKRLAERQVDVKLFRADDAIARSVPITCGGAPRGKGIRGVRDKGIRYIGSRVDPISDLRVEAARIQSVVAIEAGSEGGRGHGAGHLVGPPAIRVRNRDGRT